MNGCPHPSSFALPVPPVPPVRRFPPPGIAPLLFLFSFLTAPVPSPHSVPCSYVIPTTTLYPGPLSPPSSLSLSVSLRLSSPNVFIVAVFFLSSGLVAVCPCIASSLLRALRTKRALLSALSPLPRLPPLENVLTTSVLLFLQRSARLLSRARAVCFAIIRYVFCTFCVYHDPFLSSLPRFYQRASFSTDGFPFPASSYLNGGSPPVPLTIPNLV